MNRKFNVKPVIIQLSPGKMVLFLSYKIFRSDVFHGGKSHGCAVSPRTKDQKVLFSTRLKPEKYIWVLQYLEHILRDN